MAPASHHASPKLVALQQPGPVLASPLLDISFWLGSNLATSPIGLPNVSLSALNLVIDLSYFDLHQVSDNGALTSPPLTPRQHTMVLRPRKARTANLSITSTLGLPLSLPMNLLPSRRHNTHYLGKKLCKRKSRLCMIMVHARGLIILEVDGFIKSNSAPMVVLKDIKPSWWLGGLFSKRGLTILRHLAL